MQTILDIEEAVARLPEEELVKFRAWFEEFDAQRWDRQFEADVEAGKLEELGRQAIKDFRAGRCKWAWPSGTRNP